MMDKYILNISHAVPTVMRADFIPWIKNVLDNFEGYEALLDSYSLAELTQKSPEGDDMIVLQVFFKIHTPLVEVQEVMDVLVQLTHTHFGQKVLAFGSVMKEI